MEGLDRLGARDELEELLLRGGLERGQVLASYQVQAPGVAQAQGVDVLAGEAGLAAPESSADDLGLVERCVRARGDGSWLVLVRLDLDQVVEILLVLAL